MKPIKETTALDWGDGTIVTVRKPILEEIPGSSVINKFLSTPKLTNFLTES